MERWPDRIALAIGEEKWTYGQLHEIVLSYSAWCEANTKKPAQIAVFGTKAVDTYAAILGILRSGRSYVPLHPDHPPARWRTMLEKAEVKAGFISARYADKIRDLSEVNWCNDPGSPKTARSPSYINAKAEAYVMFTSGSTGGPKGVPVGRTQVATYLQHQLKAYELSQEDRFTQFFALSFDLSVHDLFICWGAGGCLCVQEKEDPLLSAAFAREHQITVWFSVPSQVQLLRRMRALRPDSLPGLKYSFFCGEPLLAETIKAWRQAAPNSRLINLYGPTEATIAITSHEINEARLDESSIIPIGIPFPGHAVLVDDGASLRPMGEGELLINGPQVNEGYLKDQQATERSFLPADDGSWYRTGDRVKIGTDGTLHFLGRMDDQVKLAGHRVEPAEVDVLLAPLLSNGSSITLPITRDGDHRLITFIDVAADVEALFAHLRLHLPAYMIPDRILEVDAFPYGAHGKLDKRSLLDRASGA